MNAFMACLRQCIEPPLAAPHAAAKDRRRWPLHTPFEPVATPSSEQGPHLHLQKSHPQPRELMLRQPHQLLRLAGSIASGDQDLASKELFVMRLPHHQTAPIETLRTALMQLPQSAISDVAQFAPVHKNLMRCSHRPKKCWCDFHNKKGNPLSRHDD